MEPFYPLHAYVCENCFLVQLGEFESPEQIFSEYAYFSSYSETWLLHAEKYAGMAIERFGLTPASHVIEIASNDGYLLRYFKEKHIPVLGIEPARNVAKAAQEAGIPTRIEFFGADTARTLSAEGLGADLLIANNVLAHVPALNDFVSGIRIALRPGRVATLEFPHLLRLMEGNEFDTIYHEHLSYFSLSTAQRIFAAHELTLFDLDVLPTHGGSLRIYVRHAEDAVPAAPAVNNLLKQEHAAGMGRLETYQGFAEQVRDIKRRLLALLIDIKACGKKIAGYGAPAKGNTLLNYCGIRADFLDFTVDRNPYKQGRYLPGTAVPILAPERIREARPDYVLILPWNLREEIIDSLSFIRQWGGQFILPIPAVEVVP
jgi:SAM-dependent methyltransferase